VIPHEIFPILGTIVAVLWGGALIAYLPPVACRLRIPLGTVLFVLGWLCVLGYLAWLWVALERPPFRTQGETRLWYVAWLPAIALGLERWGHTRRMAIPALVMGEVFLLITLAHPESFDKSLMPALRSAWFVPHVIVYMMAYATLGVAAAIAIWGWVRDLRAPGAGATEAAEVGRLVELGFPLLTAGLILGAVWAKIAWGHYWTWDPKETWAFITWVLYLGFLHVRGAMPLAPRMQLVIVAGGFLILLGCWFGVNVLPTAQQSVHSYMN
jgi:ABC-type transport system involved in cytochrome c biogenesis permease subunit